MKKNFRISLSMLTAVLMLMYLLPFQAYAVNTIKPLCQETVGNAKPGESHQTYSMPKTQPEIDKTCAACHIASNLLPENGHYYNAFPEIDRVPRRTENRGNGEIWDGSIAEGFSCGTGTEADPYLISNGAEFAYIAEQVNLGVENGGSDYAGVYFKMTADIYLNDIADWENWAAADSEGNITAPANEWTAIGNFYTPFRGNFNGDGYALFGIYINRKCDHYYNDCCQGLFGFNEGIIANLNVEASYVYGYSYVGGVAGYNAKGTVINCSNAGNIKGYEIRAGGVVGVSESYIWGSDSPDYANVIDCINAGNVSADSEVGGVVGYNIFGFITGCCNTGEVNSDNYFAGGVTGWSSGSVNCCYNVGRVNGGGDAGGIVGRSSPSDITVVNCCYNTGDVTAAEEYVGGIVGLNEAPVLYSYNTGDVSGSGYIGGIAGDNSYGRVIDCYNCGDVSGVHDVGGIAGLNIYLIDWGYNYIEIAAGVIKNCYNAGIVTGDTNTGAAIGNNTAADNSGNIYEGITENVYYLDGCCESTNPYGTPLTAEQMQNAENFMGFDFDAIWIMEGDPDYPYPELEPKFRIIFIDGLTYEQISSGYLVTAGSILNEADFPAPPVHEGCDFLGWNYDGTAIFKDTVIKARYYDPNAARLNGYIVSDAIGQWGIDYYVWNEFVEYEPESVTFRSEMPELFAAAYAGGNVYGFLNTEYDWPVNTAFYIMDAETFEVSYPGYHSDRTVYAMAYNHAEGEMYAIAAAEPGNTNMRGIYKVNLAVGSLEYVADLNANGEIIMTLAIDGEGNAYGLSYSDTDAGLYSIDLATGICTLKGNTGIGLNYVQSMTWDHNTGKLFWAQYLNEKDNGLYIVDSSNGAVSFCGHIGGGVEVTGLWVADDMPIAPIVAPEFQITFIDDLTGKEIPGGYTTEPGTVLLESDFPEPPVHEGFDFTGWDYDGHAIYSDTVVRAVYWDPLAAGFYFETDPAPEGWECEDNDGDGYNWHWMYNTAMNVPEGLGMMNSESFNNQCGSLTPDNWLISPEVPGGGHVSFMFVGQDPSFASEVIGVYASADGGNTWSDELGYFVASGAVQTKTVNLAQFANQNIRIAFRHYDVTEQFCVNLDAVRVSSLELPVELPTEPPTEVPPTEEPPTAEPPTAEPPTAEPPTEEPPTEEPPTETPTEPPTPPPHTGFISLAGAGVAAILAGTGVVLFRRKRR